MGLQDFEEADECHLLGTSFKTFMDVFINNGSPKLYFWKSITHFVVSKPCPKLAKDLRHSSKNICVDEKNAWII